MIAYNTFFFEMDSGWTDFKYLLDNEDMNALQRTHEFLDQVHWTEYFL